MLLVLIVAITKYIHIYPPTNTFFTIQSLKMCVSLYGLRTHLLLLHFVDWIFGLKKEKRKMKRNERIQIPCSNLIYIENLVCYSSMSGSFRWTILTWFWFQSSPPSSFAFKYQNQYKLTTFTCVKVKCPICIYTLYLFASFHLVHHITHVHLSFMHKKYDDDQYTGFLFTSRI